PAKNVLSSNLAQDGVKQQFPALRSKNLSGRYTVAYCVETPNILFLPPPVLTCLERQIKKRHDVLKWKEKEKKAESFPKQHQPNYQGFSSEKRSESDANQQDVAISLLSWNEKKQIRGTTDGKDLECHLQSPSGGTPSTSMMNPIQKQLENALNSHLSKKFQEINEAMVKKEQAILTPTVFESKHEHVEDLRRIKHGKPSVLLQTQIIIGKAYQKPPVAAKRCSPKLPMRQAGVGPQEIGPKRLSSSYSVARPQGNRMPWGSSSMSKISEKSRETLKAQELYACQSQPPTVLTTRNPESSPVSDVYTPENSPKISVVRDPGLSHLNNPLFVQDPKHASLARRGCRVGHMPTQEEEPPPSRQDIRADIGSKSCSAQSLKGPAPPESLRNPVKNVFQWLYPNIKGKRQEGSLEKGSSPTHLCRTENPQKQFLHMPHRDPKSHPSLICGYQVGQVPVPACAPSEVTVLGDLSLLFKEKILIQRFHRGKFPFS
uniref:spermatogenesis-associated protein 31D1-like n=1 Tax=Ictidomys tridecemlineatus TaxID=43179 RepID=UPI001A9FD8BC